MGRGFLILSTIAALTALSPAPVAGKGDQGAASESFFELKVRPGHVVTGLQTRSGNYVDAIRFYQTRWDGSQLVTSESSWTQWAGAPGMGGVERAERMAEPLGTAVAVGVAGRAGGYLDNLTLVAGELGFCRLYTRERPRHGRARPRLSPTTNLAISIFACVWVGAIASALLV